MKNQLASLPELTFETASEHHTRQFPLAEPNDRAGAVWDSLRGRRFDCVDEIVVCDAKGRLVGLVNIEDLLAAEDQIPLCEIMDRTPPVVTPGVDQEVAAWQAIRHRETSLAVVDSQGRFQGMITPGRIFEVLLWEHDEDTARQGGFVKSSSEAYISSDEPVLRRLWHRVPWLLAGLLGAVASADLVGLFESQLRAELILAFFVPGVMYLADAVGTQTETLVVRGLSVGISIERVFLRELLTGLLIGIVLAVLMFLFILWRWERPEVALAVSLALLAACSIASSVAMLLPWLLHKLGQDPAIAAGPMATVIQDMLSVTLYFVICWVLV